MGERRRKDEIIQRLRPILNFEEIGNHIGRRVFDFFRGSLKSPAQRKEVTDFLEEVKLDVEEIGMLRLISFAKLYVIRIKKLV